jgi:uncharacterized protein YabE (DUF348 family)
VQNTRQGLEYRSAVPGASDVWSIVQLAHLTRARQFGRLNLSSMPTRIAAITTAAAVVVVAGGVAYAQASTKVTLSIDGTDKQVMTFSDDVSSVLRDEGITVGSRDLLAPAPSTSLRDGDTIVVKYARPMSLSIDGKAQRYWTTERTVDRALRVLGVRSTGARLSASRSQPIGRQGISIALTTPKSVTVKADGHKRSVTSTADSVGAMLTEIGLKVDSDDKVSVSLAKRFHAGQTIVVKRVVVKHKVRKESVRHKVISTATDDLYKGQSRVTTAGKDGTRRAVYLVTYVDGKETKRKLLRTTTLTAPVTEKREVGSKSRPSSSHSSSSSTAAVGGGKASGLNWAALAKCESGGNPRAVNPAGYYGLYQFSTGTWRSVGGSGLPSNASSSEQTARAQTLYNRTGASSWPHCGKYLFS